METTLGFMSSAFSVAFHRISVEYSHSGGERRASRPAERVLLGRSGFDEASWVSEPARARKAADPGHGFRIGQSALHPKFGRGVIVDAEGSSTEGRLQVNFGRQGMKWLALEYAKLTAA